MIHLFAEYMDKAPKLNITASVSVIRKGHDCCYSKAALKTVLPGVFVTIMDVHSISLDVSIMVSKLPSYQSHQNR